MLAAWTRAGHAWLSRWFIYMVDSNPVHLDEAHQRLKQNDAGSRQLHFMTPEEAMMALSELTQEQEEPFTVVIANELLDAFPVHRILKKDGRLWELGVGSHASSESSEDDDAFTNEEAFHYVQLNLRKCAFLTC